MKPLYKLLTLVLLLPLFAFANNDLGGKYKKTKTIKQEYDVNSTATLKISNKYGNIDIITWEENRIEFEITITTSGNNEEKVKEKLDKIDVEFEDSPNYVSAVTKLDRHNSRSWWSWSNNNNVNMRINYIVKMPMTNSVDLNNDYGNINLDKLEGRAKINCDYGKITTKELLADDNELNFDYTNNSYFEFIKSATIKADYSGYTVAKANYLDIQADYTKSRIEIAEDLKYSCDYGSVRADKINSLVGNGDYLTVVLGEVYKSIDINADYGSIKIGKMMKGAEDVNINSDYVGIKIGIDPEYDFNFDIELEYGSLRDADNFEFVKKRIESSDRYYTGYHNKENSGNFIKINSEYGSVSFEEK